MIGENFKKLGGAHCCAEGKEGSLGLVSGGAAKAK